MNNHHSLPDIPIIKKCFFFLHPNSISVIDVRRMHHPIKASPTLPTSQEWEDDEEDLDLQSEDEE
jgi:hypothetical protein